jgi:hypothetical protein
VRRRAATLVPSAVAASRDGSGTAQREDTNVTRIILAALAAAAFASPAAAQYYGGSDGYRGAPRGYDYDDDAPRPRRRYDPDFDDRRGPPRSSPVRPGPGRGLAATCVTGGGPCTSAPQPAGSPCVCFVPGRGNMPGTMR